MDILYPPDAGIRILIRHGEALHNPETKSVENGDKDLFDPTIPLDPDIPLTDMGIEMARYGAKAYWNNRINPERADDFIVLSSGTYLRHKQMQQIFIEEKPENCIDVYFDEGDSRLNEQGPGIFQIFFAARFPEMTQLWMKQRKACRDNPDLLFNNYPVPINSQTIAIAKKIEWSDIGREIDFNADNTIQVFGERRMFEVYARVKYMDDHERILLQFVEIHLDAYLYILRY